MNSLEIHLAIHLAVVGVLVVSLPLLGALLVARRNARMVDESAFAYCKQSDRAQLVNRRAHVNSDPRFAQNPANSGFILFYDCRSADLVVQGRAPECRFFGVSAYDAWSMPLPSMVIDRQVCGQDGVYQVTLTSTPRGTRGELDVSACPKGTAIIRFSYVTEPVEVDAFEPTLAVKERG